MYQFNAPTLYCPWTSQMNKYVDVLEDYTVEWLLRFNLLADELAVERFCKSKFFMLIAGALPYSKLEELKIANDLLSWLFIWDDQCDMSDLGEQPEELKVFHQRFIEILKGSELTSKDISLSYALSDLRERMLQMGMEKWFDYFVSSLESYFYGCVEEATYRVKRTVPDLDTYIIIRRLTAAVDPFLLLTEFYNDLIISAIWRQHNTVKKLRIMTMNIIAWCNDIFSLSREMASGEFHNLVLVMHYQQLLPLEQAIKRAIQIHDQEVRDMINLEVSIPSFGEEVDAEIAKYVSVMHAWIRGNLDWYSHSGRYKTVEKLELVKP